MEKRCLKCGHVASLAANQPCPACPECGAIYAKVERALAAELQRSEPVRGPSAVLVKVMVLGWALSVLVAAGLGVLYYREWALNQVLLTQRGVSPPEIIQNPSPPVVAPTSNRTSADFEPSEVRTSSPPADLARGARVVVVSGYEAANQAATGAVVRVTVDLPGEDIVLVLSSYEKVAWIVRAEASTRIRAVVYGGYERSSVSSKADTPVFKAKLPHSYDKNSGTFVRLLEDLKGLFGVEGIDAFVGSYGLPSDVRIDRLDDAQAELTLAGVQPEKPLASIDFELTRLDFSKDRWSLEGPETDAIQLLLMGRVVRSEVDQKVYSIEDHAFQVFDPATGRKSSLNLPDTFPSISWPSDVAYDSKRNYITFVTYGGEGFIYRYDTTAGRWLDFRSLDNIDISSLSYDQQADRYAAWTSGGALLLLAADGTPLSMHPLAKRLPDYQRLYDVGNQQGPALRIVSAGDQLALLKMDRGGVQRIWYYELTRDLVQLTYKNDH